MGFQLRLVDMVFNPFIWCDADKVIAELSAVSFAVTMCLSSTPSKSGCFDQGMSANFTVVDGNLSVPLSNALKIVLLINFASFVSLIDFFDRILKETSGQ